MCEKAGLLTLILALVVVVAAIGSYQLYVPDSDLVANVEMQGKPEQIARGPSPPTSAPAATLRPLSCHSMAGDGIARAGSGHWYRRLSLWRVVSRALKVQEP